MRFEGKLDKWNDERGFGFITPIRGGEPVFVHISAFPRDGRRPQPGELLAFEVEPADGGKKRAAKVGRPGAQPHVRSPARATEPTARRPRRIRSRFPLGGMAVGVALLVFVGNALYDQFSHFRSGAAPSPANAVQVPATPRNLSNAFRCDGRTHCSQMTSCAEATFFLKNCPDTKMDGDGDGVPCEQQWCN